MKRLIFLLTFICLLMCGCGQQSPVQPNEISECNGHDFDPYVNVDKDAFYADYTPACCYTDACYRSQHFCCLVSLSCQTNMPLYLNINLQTKRAC